MAKALQCKQENSTGASPFKDDLRVPGLSRTLEVYMGKPMAVRVGTRRGESRHHLARRIKGYYPDLSPDVCDKIASKGLQSLKRVSNCVEAIKDNLMTSSPDLIRTIAGSAEYRKLLHWAYSLGAHRTDRVTKEWKRFAVLLRWLALQSETEVPELPRDFPGFHGTWKVPELPPFWQRLLPWLVPITVRGVETKAEATRLCHLITSRNFPAGDHHTREASLALHAKTLFSEPAISPVRSKILERLSYFVGKMVGERARERGYTSNGHLSLTSSASLDSSVQVGGRAREVGVKYRNWAATRPDQDVLETTWFNRSYWKISGRPIWQTMCRTVLRHEPSHEAGESDDRVNLDFDNFKLSDPIFGLDETTGFQLLQWSIEEGLRQGVLAGSPFADSANPLRLRGEKLTSEGFIDRSRRAALPSIRPSAIGEPGAKSRVVTVGEDWVTLLLQPWCHHIVSMLKYHPSATSGLTRGWQLFEWVKRLNDRTRPRNVHFLSSDLTTATDFCTLEYSRAMLEGFHRGIGRQSDRYFALCAQVLTCGRVYECSDEGERKRFFDRPTTRGILMGDPGAKAVLTLHNLCAEYEAFLRLEHNMLDTDDEPFFEWLRQSDGPSSKSWRHFVCSGDDHFGQGPPEYLARISRNHGLNGMSVSWSQNFVSSRGGFYCEEMLLTAGLHDRQIWGGETPLRDRKYEDQPHIDAMKVRLLSPCAKEHEGKDEPNPAIGKARQMHGMLAWLGGGWEITLPIFSARWSYRMRNFLPPGMHAYLPVSLGGLEAPAYHLTMSEVRDGLRRLDGIHQWAIEQVLDGTASPLLRRAVASFATDARARGVSQDLIEDQIKETLQIMDLVHGVDDNALRILEGVEADQWRNLRWRDKVAIAKRRRLITVNDAIGTIGRPYLFRDMLYPEMSARHGIDPYRTEAYENVPWPKRLATHLLSMKGAISFPQSDIIRLRDTTIQQIAEWCVQNKALDIPREVYFFPEDVVVHEDLATLRTPL